MSETERPNLQAALLIAPHEELNRVLVVRTVDGYATHWMDSYGAWVSLPETVEEMGQLMEQLDANPEMLPMLDQTNIEVIEEGQPAKDYEDVEIPFGD